MCTFPKFVYDYSVKLQTIHIYIRTTNNLLICVERTKQMRIYLVVFVDIHCSGLCYPYTFINVHKRHIEAEVKKTMA